MVRGLDGGSVPTLRREGEADRFGLKPLIAFVERRRTYCPGKGIGGAAGACGCCCGCWPLRPKL